MDIFKYIIAQINQFLLSFTNAKVRYGYDDLARVHTLEVYPSTLFASNSFQEWEGSILEDFIKRNPTESLCVCPEDDVLGIGEIIYSKMGVDYNPISISNVSFIPRTNCVQVQFGDYTTFSLSQGGQDIKRTDNHPLLESSIIDEYPLAA